MGASGELALALDGGGARAAYQVGILRAIARRHPRLETPILTGVSAGAINTAHLANHPGDLQASVEDLAATWSDLDVGDVLEVRTLQLAWRVLRVGLRLSVGLPPGVPRPSGMVDTSPLRETLLRALGSQDGTLPGIRRNLERGRLRAVALVTTRYATGQTVTFYAGRDIVGWVRPQRRAVEAELGVDHVMASAALPLFFPSVEIDGVHYGDGGVRLVTPLAPALHLGAGRVLAISTRYRRTGEEADEPVFRGVPSPAQILGVLFNAVFLDQLDQDALHLERINQLVRALPEDQRLGLRPVRLLLVRPSFDLGRLANEFEPRLPWLFRQLTRRLGTRESRTQDLLSTLLFQRDYVQRLIELGEQDGEALGERLDAFLEG